MRASHYWAKALLVSTAVVIIVSPALLYVLRHHSRSHAPSMLQRELRRLFGYSPMDDPEFRTLGGVTGKALRFVKGQLYDYEGAHGELPADPSRGEDVPIALVPQIRLDRLAPAERAAALRFRYLNRCGVSLFSLAPRTIILAEDPEDPNAGQWLMFADGSWTCAVGPLRKVGEVLGMPP